MAGYGEIEGPFGVPAVLPHPPPLALGGCDAGTKDPLGVPTGSWLSCPWLSSFCLGYVRIGFLRIHRQDPLGPTCGPTSLIVNCFHAVWGVTSQAD